MFQISSMMLEPGFDNEMRCALSVTLWTYTLFTSKLSCDSVILGAESVGIWSCLFLASDHPLHRY